MEESEKTLRGTSDRFAICTSEAIPVGNRILIPVFPGEPLSAEEQRSKIVEAALSILGLETSEDVVHAINNAKFMGDRIKEAELDCGIDRQDRTVMPVGVMKIDNDTAMLNIILAPFGMSEDELADRLAAFDKRTRESDTQ